MRIHSPIKAAIEYRRLRRELETQRGEPMIVCSCNVLSENDVRACLDPGPRFPRTPAQVYQCLGCSPNCGRCARTLRSIITDALGSATAECERGCFSASHMLANPSESETRSQQAGYLP